MEAAATVSAVLSAWAVEDSPARSSSASAACRRIARWPKLFSVSGSSLALSTRSRSTGGCGCARSAGRLQGGAGDAGVDGRVEDLRQRADRGGALEGALERHHVFGATHTLSNTTEPLPVVRWPKPLQSSITSGPGCRRDEGQVLHACSSTTRVGMRWA
jgi:hypothetical protein